jgi:hypothetical protein
VYQGTFAAEQGIFGPEQGIYDPCFLAREGLVPRLTCYKELSALWTSKGRIPAEWNIQ